MTLPWSTGNGIPAESENAGRHGIGSRLSTSDVLFCLALALVCVARADIIGSFEPRHQVRTFEELVDRYVDNPDLFVGRYVDDPDLSPETLDSLRTLVSHNYSDPTAQERIYDVAEQFAANGYSIGETTRIMGLLQVFPDTVFYFGPKHLGRLDVLLPTMSDSALDVSLSDSVSVSFLLELEFVVLDTEKNKILFSVHQMEHLGEELQRHADSILEIVSGEIREMTILELAARPCFLRRSTSQIEDQVVSQLSDVEGVRPELRQVLLRRNLVEKQSKR